MNIKHRDNYIIQLYKQGYSTIKIGRGLNYAPAHISRILKNHNIIIRTDKLYCTKFNNQQAKSIIKLYQNGYSSTKLAKKFNSCHATITRLLRKYKINIPTTAIKIKLRNNKMIITILYNRGYSSRQIGNKFNVSGNTILNYLKSWKIKIRNCGVKQIYTKRETKKRQNDRQTKYNKLHRQQIQQRENLRRKVDINYRILGNLRTRLYCALKGNQKSLSTMFLIGCEVDFLLYHIQKQFTKGMNWNNYGYYGWHIDHIKPCSSFDLSIPKEQHKCFHYTNLQPLWAEDNRAKRNNLYARA